MEYADLLGNKTVGKKKAALETKASGIALRLLLVLSAAIFVAELSVMLILHYVLVPESPVVMSLVDGLLLVGLIFPVLYFMVLRPLMAQFTIRQRAEETLLKARDGLEMQVHERTAELVKANESLRLEVAQRSGTEEEAQRNYRIQAALSAILRISLVDIPLEGQLARILDEIISTPWLTLEPRGCIFLVGSDPMMLELTAQVGLSAAQKTKCKHLPFGLCYCGRAAATRQVWFPPAWMSTTI